jgi:dienelactone hydrolase
MTRTKKTGRTLFFLLLQFAVFGALQAQTQFYVSPSGDDGNDGSRRRPFRTIEKAQTEARKTQGETTVFLREATYRLAVPLRFTPQDGASGKSLVIRAFPGEKVVLSGGVMLDNLQWRPHKNGILKTRVTGRPLMDMLLVNGEIRPMARYPNYDPKGIRFNGTSADATAPKRVKTWKNPAGGYLHAMHSHDWGGYHYRITGKDEKGNLSLEGGWQNNQKAGPHAANRMVENIFEELDAPGEWFYDAEQATLYYYPLKGEDVNNASFESPQTKCLIEFRGDLSSPVRNITVEGIALTQTLRTFMEPYESLLRSDWAIYRGGAVFFEGTEHCGLKNCNLYNLGGNAVFFSKYNRHGEVSGSHFTRIGASAVCFVGDPEAVRSPCFGFKPGFIPPEKIDRTRGPKSENYPADCRVHDNLIHRIGLYEKQTAGVELSMCRAVTVSHNSIYDTPRAGINISEGTWGGHVIEFNDVFNTVKETGDHGSFNSWGRDRYWHINRKTLDSLLLTGHKELILADAIETVIMRNNRFRCDRGWDIDLDDGSTNYHIYNNLCLNGGLKLREGFYRVVENNILVNSTFHRHVWFKGNGTVFTRNIVMQPYRTIPVSGLDMQDTLIDRNIFTDSRALKTARNYGTDARSIVANVKFINPAAGDFRVSAEEAEVFRAGFQNFDMDKFGVVSGRLKALAKQPVMPVPVYNIAASDSERLTWEGVQIKNLTLGERSALGMASERGVYVVAVDAYGTPLIDWLKANDVILGFAGKPVNNLTDLFNAIAGVNLKEPQQITVLRNHKEQDITLPAGIIRANIRSPKSGNSAPPAAPAATIDASSLWNADAYLNHPPKAVFGKKRANSRVREVYYEGESFQGKPTRVFAYLGMPEGPAPFDGKYPAILLIHGGAGKAYAHWAELWAKRGYVALTMDLNAQGPNAPLPDGGPRMTDTVIFRDFTVADGDYKNMWTYQAIAAILRGHALLLAQPEVAPDRIAATGISWGGYLTCILAGVDPKLRVAVPVYGCGFIHENSYWKTGTFDLMTPEQRNRWVSLFDPSKYLGRATIPMLFVNGTNDLAYPLDSYRKSYRLPKGETALAITLRRKHGHHFTFKEVDTFIDSVIYKDIKPVKPLPKILEMKTDKDEKTVSATFKSEVPVVKAELAWTADTGEWPKRKWKTAPATLSGSTVSSPLPTPSPTCYYILLTDARGLPVSSPIKIKEISNNQ